MDTFNSRAYARGALLKYVDERARAAGKGVFGGGSPEQEFNQLRGIYLQPLDALRQESEKRLGRFTSFANYDYLNLANDARVRRAACDAVMQFGIGAEASRLVGGERTIHGALERELAGFLRTEDVLTLVSGYMTNVSLVGYLLARGDLILLDELAHNSVMAGAHLSDASALRFRHGDLDHLEALLAKRRRDVGHVLIVVEGLYSMDGDVPDLPRLLALRDKYDAWLLIDEAHSIGVLGATGRGITEYFGIDSGEVDFIVGTLSKTFASCGGFIAGRRRVIDWLRFTLPAFAFSVGLPPPTTAAVLEGLTILQTEPARVAQMRENSQTFLREAKARGLDTGRSIGVGVVPILFSSHEACAEAANALLGAGYYAPPIPQLAVAKNKPRLRFFVTSAHTREEIVGVLDVLNWKAPPSTKTD